jgi:hypothetical protein
VKRLVLVGGLLAVVSLATATVAWGDATPLCNGQPCIKGLWYTSPVSVTWDLKGDNNGGGCAPQNYSADTNQSYLQSESMQDWPVWTFCNDTTSGDLKYYFIQVQLSSPTATATPARSPDSAGWYNHPLAISFQGSSFSGIASCTPAITYAGPASPGATVTGSCTDNAGKTVTVTSSPFAYDATPPSLTATATAGDQTIALNWQTSGDIAPVATVQVTRSGGPGAAGAVPVYSGTATGFNDTHLRNGVHYTYTITARDAAGNVTVQTIGATPAARLLSPSNNARVTAPPLLSWTAVSGATYYNVQLYRGDPTKLLSLWPTRASLRLRRAWRFDGRRYRLKPGRYRWYVWPGFGKRKSARYGHRIGTGTFVVVP